MPMQGSMSIERMCQLAEVSRAGFYRSLRERTPAEEDMELRSAIQQIALEHRRRYGYRRISAELRRRGMLANHKRVVRLMREDNLRAIQPPAVCGHHRFPSRTGGLSESGASHEAHWHRSALGGRHHVHSTASRVCVLSGDLGWILSQSRGLDSGANAHEPAGDSGVRIGHRKTAAAARSDSSLGSRRSVRLWGIRIHPRPASELPPRCLVLSSIPKAWDETGNLHRRCFAQRNPNRSPQPNSLERARLALRLVATHLPQGGRGNRRPCPRRDAQASGHKAAGVVGIVEERSESREDVERIIRGRTRLSAVRRRCQETGDTHASCEAARRSLTRRAPTFPSWLAPCAKGDIPEWINLPVHRKPHHKIEEPVECGGR
jgi:hypothetical protein